MKGRNYHGYGNVKDFNNFSTKVKNGTNYIVTANNFWHNNTGGFIKFTAPKTKKYKVTVSGIDSGMGYSAILYAHTKNPRFPKSVRTIYFKNPNYSVVAPGDKDFRLFFKNSNPYESRGDYPTTATGTLKIKKGQTVYFYIDFHHYGYDKLTSASCKFSIK